MADALATRSSPHGWRIGSLGGIPVYLGRSWPIIVIVIVALYGPDLARRQPSVLAGYLIALAYAVLLLLSVLLHEAAHALAARSRGQRVDRVVADMWGGHTVYDATRATPGTTAFVAAVGPLTNILLGAAGLALLPLVGGTTLLLLQAVAVTNLIVGGFNLLPGLPMDGGQIVSALVWKVTGRRSTGLVAAGWLGRLVALGMVVFAAIPVLGGSTPNAGTLIWVVIALFLWKGASDAIRTGPLMDVTSGSFRDVLEPAVVVDLRDTVESAVRRVTAQQGPVFVVVRDETGTPVGTLDAGTVQGVPVADHARTLVAAAYVAQPESWVVRLQADATLADLVRPMVVSSLTAAAVVDRDTGALLGVARAERMNDYIGVALEQRRRR